MKNLLTKLYYVWFTNKEYWFSHNLTYDKYLCDKYMLLLTIDSDIIYSRIESIYRTFITSLLFLYNISNIEDKKDLYLDNSK